VRRADKIPPSCADCLQIWQLQPPGTLRACKRPYSDCFTFTFTPRDDVKFETLRAHFRGMQRILMHLTLLEFLLKRDSTGSLKGIQRPTEESVNWKYFVIL
jgi:hypothetical protein